MTRSGTTGANYGPLTGYVSQDASDWFSAVHGSILKIALLAAIGLHLLAIGAYALVKRHDLVRPMITGKKLLPAATRAPRLAPNALGLAILAAAAVVVAVIASRG